MICRGYGLYVYDLQKYLFCIEIGRLRESGLCFESEGENVCVEIFSLPRETYNEQGHLATRVVSFANTADSYIDLFLNE